jgi:hypothetical protein
MNTPLRLLVLSFALYVLGCESASAICVPGQHDRYVGNTATDTKCTDNDIQSAIDNTICPGTNIYITGEHTYTAQHLNINNKSIALIGVGMVGCGPPGFGGGEEVANSTEAITVPQNTLSGTGQTSQSVISISGASTVTLRYLSITGGDHSGAGGGINFSGTGSLTLDTTTVVDNTATTGGGIDFNGSSEDSLATLTLDNYTQIIDNTATDSGGGVRVEGNAIFNALSDSTLIALNQATGEYGGGVQVIAPAVANIGSPGFSGLGVIYNNTAPKGGGISVNSRGDGLAVLNIFSTDADHPTRIQSNTATVGGGGIYVLPTTQGIAPYALVCGWDFRIDDNVAPEGTAIYSDSASAFGQQDTSATIELNGQTDAQLIDCLTRPVALGAVACSASANCSSIDGNAALDVTHGSKATAGSAVFLKDYGNFYGDRFVVHDNLGGHALRIDGDHTDSTLQNCLFTANTNSAEMFYVSGNATPLTINNCTLAGNTIAATHVFHDESDLTLTNSIIDAVNTLAVDYSGNPANFVVHYVLSTDISTLPASSNVFSGDPMFVNAAAGNFHLQAYEQSGTIFASPAIDFAPIVAGDDRDLDNNPHDQDVPLIINRFGARDLGAYEAQPIVDRIFADAFGDPVQIAF